MGVRRQAALTSKVNDRSSPPQKMELSSRDHPRSLGSGTESEPTPRSWRGGSKALRIEGEVVASLLRSRKLERLLDAGSGVGALTEVLSALSTKVISLDLSRIHLVQARASSARRCPPSLVQGDCLSLPFRPSSFSAVTMVRVLHRIRDPETAIREARRVLRPGGWLLLTLNPRPSLKTLDQAIWNAIKREPRSGRVPRARMLAASESHRAMVTLVREHGFKLEAEVPGGLEDVSFLRALPAAALKAAGPGLPHAEWFPTYYCLFQAA